MYEFEINNRQQFAYPPFSRIIEITLKHKVKEVVDEVANKLGLALKRDLNNFVVGPAAPVVARVRNQYLMELLIQELQQILFMLKTPRLSLQKVITVSFMIVIMKKITHTTLLT